MISRIENVVSRHGERFLGRVFTSGERAYVERFSGSARMGGYAKRWAAKEACAKALGTGFAQGVSFLDIQVLHNEAGAPRLMVSGEAERALWRLVPKGKEPDIFVSLSDDPPFALAQVLIQLRDSSV